MIKTTTVCDNCNGEIIGKHYMTHILDMSEPQPRELSRHDSYYRPGTTCKTIHMCETCYKNLVNNNGTIVQRIFGDAK